MSQTSQLKTDTNEDDDIDLLQLFHNIIAGRWIIIFSSILCLLIAFLYAQFATPIYSADALVQIEEKKGGGLLALGDLGAAFGSDSSSSTEIELLRSRLVLGKVVEKLKLDIIAEPRRLPMVGNYLKRHNLARPNWAFLHPYAWHSELIHITYLELPEALQGEHLRLTLAKAHKFHLSTWDGIHLLEGEIGETASNDDGSIVIGVADLIAQPGQEFIITKLQKRAAIDALSDKLQIAEQGKKSGMLQLRFESADPKFAERILTAISQEYLLQNVKYASEEAEQGLEFLDKKIPEAQQTLTKSEDTLNAYRLEQSSVNLSIETESVLQRIVALDARLNELGFQEAELSRRFTQNHPTFAALLEKKQQLLQERNNINKQVKDLPVTQQEVLRLTRDVQVNQEIYLQLLNKTQELSILKAGTIGNVRVIDPGVASIDPIKPKKSLIIALGALVGFILGTVIVLMRMMLRQGVQRPDQIEALGLPVYASLPNSAEQSRLEKISAKRTDTSSLLAVSNPADLAIESLKSLRTSLHFGKLEAENNRIMVSGPSPGIGKTFVSANLAAVMAQSDERTIIIDADMRKGRLHKMFNLKKEDGLSELLAGTKQLDEVIHKDIIPNLSVITQGTIPPNPAELLMHPRLLQVLDALSERFDTVLIDTPPLLAVTDAALIGKHCGMRLLVVRWNFNHPKEVALTKTRFEQNQIRLTGAVLNGIERSSGRQSNGQYGYYQYHYGQD